MSTWSIFVLAIGLSMDAAAVAAARGLATRVLRPRHVIIIAVAFGGAQALMPVAGAALGHLLGPALQAWSHVISSALLFVVGGKMAWEAAGSDRDGNDDAIVGDDALYGARVIGGLAVATSIDAFGAGVLLSMMQAPMVLSIAVIGATTAVLSAVAVLLGRRVGALLGRRLDVVGAVVLLGLGFKILVDGLLR